MERLLLTTATLLGLWVLVSFAATMVADRSRADFWIRSLLWSVLSVAVMAPVLAMLIRSVAAAPVPADPTDTRPPAPETKAPGRAGWPYNSTAYEEVMAER